MEIKKEVINYKDKVTGEAKSFCRYAVVIEVLGIVVALPIEAKTQSDKALLDLYLKEGGAC